jgi:ADP-heptose:LPS heptosyltransferase
MSDNYCVFQVQGGLGKHILSTAVAQVIKRTYPERKLIVIAAWPEIFTNLPFVDRVYQLGNTQYFYDDYVKGRDSKFFIQEPYFVDTHINKKLPLVESWCKLYNLDYQGEKPIVKINPQQRSAISNFYQSEKPILLIQTGGGMYTSERPYSWARDMPQDVAQKVANHFSRKYQVLQITRVKGYKLNNVTVQDRKITNVELIGLLECTKKRLLIDSCLQHAAAALTLPSTVLWQATSPVIFGHEIHKNILAKPKENERLPWSVYFDYQFDQNDQEFPYEEEDIKDMYNLDEIIASLEN